MMQYRHVNQMEICTGLSKLNITLSVQEHIVTLNIVDIGTLARCE